MDVWMCFVVAVLCTFSMESMAQRKSCSSLTLKNGRVRIRGGGRMAYFRCKKKFKRVGHKLAVCLSSGTWSQQTPVCVGRGCPDLGTLPDLTVTEMYKGGILQFSCPEGMRREGPQKLMCDGTNWDQAPPKCLYGVSLGCDFEDSGLCGWSQDANDDFDWTWTSGFTPTTETGPEADHTTGSGHYIFMESSAPQKSGQVTRLISPPYQPTEDEMCIEFFYHMKGPPKQNEVGDLDVYIRTGSSANPSDLTVFHRNSYQGDDWIRGVVTIPEQVEVYRIVFAATRRESWTGDIALDDIRVLNCSELVEVTTVGAEPTTEMTTTTTTTTLAPTAITTVPSTVTTTTTTTTTPKPTTIFITTTSPTTTTTTTTTTTSTTTTTPTSPTTTTLKAFTTSTTSTTTTPPTSTTSTTTATSTTTTSTTATETGSTSTSTSPKTMTTSTSSTTTGSDVDVTSSTMTRPTYYPVSSTSSTMEMPKQGTSSTSPGKDTASSTTSLFTGSMSSTTAGEDSNTTNAGTDTTQEDFSSQSETKTGSSSGGETSDDGSSLSDYVPLIVGVSLGLAVGMIVVGVLAWLWARNRRKQKEIEIEEDQLNIIGSIDGNSYSYPPSGSEH